ncbi:MAG: histidine kinase, partial [Brevundimonas sp. 32-68-21]
MRLPSLLRRTPFRLTLLFLALFVAAAGAILAYVYFLNQALVERTIRGGPYLYLLTGPDGKIVTGNLSVMPFDLKEARRTGTGEWSTFRLTSTDPDGRVQTRRSIGVIMPLAGGDTLFVGEDIGGIEEYLSRLTQALWGAMALVMLLGLAGGLYISRRVESAMAGLNRVV